MSTAKWQNIASSKKFFNVNYVKSTFFIGPCAAPKIFFVIWFLWYGEPGKQICKYRVSHIKVYFLNWLTDRKMQAKICLKVVYERPLKYLSFYSDIAIFQVLLVTWLACPWQLNRQCQIMLYTDHPWEKLQTEIFRWHAFYLRLCCGPLVRLSPYLVHK